MSADEVTESIRFLIGCASLSINVPAVVVIGGARSCPPLYL
jgi:hypothetical protein